MAGDEIGQWLEKERQAQQMAQGIAFLSLIAEIIATPPPKREHWWQFWRER
jgi:hypothetical protein